MMQRKNNYHVNDIKVENLSCVCEWGNFRNDKHQVICMKLARVTSTVNKIYIGASRSREISLLHNRHNHTVLLLLV